MEPFCLFPCPWPCCPPLSSVDLLITTRTNQEIPCRSFSVVLEPTTQLYIKLSVADANIPSLRFGRSTGSSSRGALLQPLPREELCDPHWLPSCFDLRSDGLYLDHFFVHLFLVDCSVPTIILTRSAPLRRIIIFIFKYVFLLVLFLLLPCPFLFITGCTHTHTHTGTHKYLV